MDRMKSIQHNIGNKYMDAAHMLNAIYICIYIPEATSAPSTVHMDRNLTSCRRCTNAVSAPVMVEPLLPLLLLPVTEVEVCQTHKRDLIIKYRWMI